jgi:hypothetical protein
MSFSDAIWFLTSYPSVRFQLLRGDLGPVDGLQDKILAIPARRGRQTLCISSALSKQIENRVMTTIYRLQSKQFVNPGKFLFPPDDNGHIPKYPHEAPRKPNTKSILLLPTRRTLVRYSIVLMSSSCNPFAGSDEDGGRDSVPEATTTTGDVEDVLAAAVSTSLPSGPASRWRSKIIEAMPKTRQQAASTRRPSRLTKR